MYCLIELLDNSHMAFRALNCTKSSFDVLPCPVKVLKVRRLRTALEIDIIQLCFPQGKVKVPDFL